MQAGWGTGGSTDGKALPCSNIPAKFLQVGYDEELDVDDPSKTQFDVAYLAWRAAENVIDWPEDTSALSDTGWQQGTQYTVQQVAAMTVAGDASQCYYAIFSGKVCESPGSVYRIDSDWYKLHGGGSFGEKNCGTVVG